MKKVPISVTEPQESWLKQEKKRTGLSVAEIVRRILDNHIKGEKQNGRQEG
jgi:hypothetical protein